MSYLSNTIEFTYALTDCLDNELDLLVVFSYTPGDPGRYFDLPENCYPATDPEVEIESITIPLPAKPRPIDLTAGLAVDEPENEFELSTFLPPKTMDDIELACFDELKRLKEEAEIDRALS